MNWKKICLVSSLFLFLFSHAAASSSAEWSFYWSVGGPDITPSTIKIFLIEGNTYTGLVLLNIRVDDDNAIISGWLDANVSSDCFPDVNVSIGDNNLFWQPLNYEDCPTIFDINIQGHAYDYAWNEGFDSKAIKVDNSAEATFYLMMFGNPPGTLIVFSLIAFAVSVGVIVFYLKKKELTEEAAEEAYTNE